MMDQYRRIRRDLPADAILFFRLGDFYEMFFDDAQTAAPILDIALTKRQTMPMCGVPYHSAELYIAKLIRAGKKVAICEQMEDPSATKGIVRREVTRVITPGTVLEDHVLESKKNNYLAGLVQAENGYGLAFLDLSTGAFWLEESASASAVEENLSRYAPSECVVPFERRDDPAFRGFFHAGSTTVLTGHDDWTFETEAAADLLTRHFKVHSLDGFGLRDCPLGLRAAGAVLHYVGQALRRSVDHVRHLRVKRADDYMLLDEATVRNLDLVDGAASVLGVLDATRTAMGARLLRDWLVRPRLDLAEITRRHDALEGLQQNRGTLADLREALGEIRDLERLMARLNAGTGNARDVRQLGRSLAGLPRAKALLAGLATPLLAELDAALRPHPELVELIEQALVDEPPALIKEGGLFRPGYHAELDELRDATTTCSATSSRSPRPTWPRPPPTTSASRRW